VNVFAIDRAPFDAVTVTTNDTVGLASKLPEIMPVEALIANPDGKPTAEYAIVRFA